MDTPIDRKYNAQNLKEVLPLLEGMEYFVFYGTLLGLVREGDILEKDDDIDIILEYDTNHSWLTLSLLLPIYHCIICFYRARLRFARLLAFPQLT